MLDHELRESDEQTGDKAYLFASRHGNPARPDVDIPLVFILVSTHGVEFEI